jgi:hypothetical protein
MPPEDWRVSRDKFINLCLNGGKGCPVLSRYYSIVSKTSEEKRVEILIHVLREIVN